MRVAARAAVLAVILCSMPARADPARVLVDIATEEDEVSRATATRLLAELSVGGFGAGTTASEADARVSLVLRDGRPVLYIELPNGRTGVIRAEDVSPAEAPSVVALRTVEWLRAALSAPQVPEPASTPSLVAPAPTSPAASTSPPAPAPSAAAPPSAASVAPSPRPSASRALSVLSKPALRTPFDRRHAFLGATVALDGGAVSIAPTASFGVGLAPGVFVRGTWSGPSTIGTVTAAQGSATIQSLGGRIDAGLAWPLHETVSVGASAGLGAAVYLVEGRAGAGYVARTESSAVLTPALDAFVSWRLAGPIHLLLDLGASAAFPSLDVKIAGVSVAERGLPALHATLGAMAAF